MIPEPQNGVTQVGGHDDRLRPRWAARSGASHLKVPPELVQADCAGVPYSSAVVSILVRNVRIGRTEIDGIIRL